MHAAVPTDDVSTLINDRAFARDRGRLCGNERGVITVRYKANLLAVRLVGHVQSKSSCLRPDFDLVQVADGEDGTGELRLR